MEQSVEQHLFQKLVSCFESFSFDEINCIIDDETNNSSLIEIAWELVPKICFYLNKENSSQHDILKCCEHFLQKLCEIGNVKEVLLMLLEQLDVGIPDIRLITLLEPIQKCLLSLPTKRGHSLSITFETLYECLYILPLPEVSQLQDEERPLLDSDTDVRRIIHIINEVLLFLEPFVNDALSSKNQKREITKFLIKILDHPLGHLDLNIPASTDVKVTKSRSRYLGERLLGLLAKLENDFSAVIRDLLLVNDRIHSQQRSATQTRQSEDLMLEKPIPELGLGNFAFLTLTDHHQHNNCKPKVYTTIHWLKLTSHLIQVLLQHNNVLIKDRGIALITSLLWGCEEILSEYFQWDDCKELMDGITKVMCNSQSKLLAQSALTSYSLLYKKCQPERRFKILYYTLSKSNHSGILGYTITQLKDDINANLMLSGQQNVYFKSPNLLKIFKIVFILPEHEQTDLLESIDRIMSALNLLRYLVVRDKPDDNNTGIWSSMKTIEKEFLQPLRVDVNMSKAHYDLEIQQISSGKIQNPDEVAFCISGEAMPGISREQKLEVMEMAVYRLDMIESVLVRAEELINIAQTNKS